MCVGTVLVVLGWLGAWSNHFGNSFHSSDIPTIVNNPFIPHLSNIPRFFSNPRTFSAMKDTADYRPLLSTSFALDYSFAGAAKPFIFQAENFFWFGMQVLLVFLLFRVIPGGNVWSAAFGAFLYGLHPVTAETVNDPLQRGVIMGSLGVIAGMVLWIVWPRFLPQKLPIKLKRVPQTGLDEYLRNNFASLEARYLKLIHLPIGLYFWPVAFALLFDPAAAVFAPILVVYILLFETDRKPKHAIPAAVACIGYWIFQTIFTFKYAELFRVPASNYWFTQPWVALRYLFQSFLPLHLTAETDLAPAAHFWSPLALAGYAGVGLLVALAVYFGRREEWRTVAFGIWWFLIALTPYALVPHRLVEADWRMYLALVGLALAISRAGWIAFALVFASGRRVEALVAFPSLALLVLIVLGWGTYQRNEVWRSEETLWSDAMSKSPLSGRAVMNLGVTRVAKYDRAAALKYFLQAEALSPNDAVLHLNVAHVYDMFSRDKETEAWFRRAMEDAPRYSPAYSTYAQWLMGQGRTREAVAMAGKAIDLDTYDLSARRTVMEALSQQHRWVDLKRIGTETLALYPDDQDGARAVNVAQTGLDQVPKAEHAAKQAPSVDNYLALSVHYYESQRYEDSIRAAKKALEINPNQAEAYSNIAAAYHTMGKLDETVTALQEAIRLNPDLPAAAANLRVVLAEKAKAGH
jgi:protein O-mannosyl-transferase